MSTPPSTPRAIPFIVLQGKTKIADGICWPDGVYAVFNTASGVLQEFPSVPAIRLHLETTGVPGEFSIEFCTETIGTLRLEAPAGDTTFTITKGDIAFRAATSGRLFSKNTGNPPEL